MHLPALGRALTWKMIDCGVSVAVLAALGTASGCAQPNKPVTRGNTAPPWTLADTNGVEHSLADYRGKVVLMDFWASWCGPCRRATPHVQAMAEKYAGNGLVVLCFQHQDDADPRPYMREHELTYTFFPKADDVARAYGAGLPSFVIVDRDGNVAWHKGGFGPGDEARIAAAVERVLEM